MIPQQTFCPLHRTGPISQHLLPHISMLSPREGRVRRPNLMPNKRKASSFFFWGTRDDNDDDDGVLATG